MPIDEQQNVTDDEWLARPFDPAERRHIRQTVADFERFRWLIKLISLTVGAAAGAWAIVWGARDSIAKALRVFLKIP